MTDKDKLTKNDVMHLEVMSLQEAAVYLGVSPQTVDRRKGKHLRFSKLGDRIIFRKEWLIEALERNAIG